MLLHIGSAFDVEAALTDTVAALKRRIELLHAIPATKQRLLFERHVLDDSRMLESYDMCEGSRLVLDVRESFYSLLRPADIIDMSIGEITQDKRQLIDAPGSLSDPKMGPRRPTEICPTCQGTFWSCLGHAGHIALCEPVFAMHFVPYITKHLQALCLKCCKDVSSPTELRQRPATCAGKCQPLWQIKWDKDKGLYLIKRTKQASEEEWTPNLVRQTINRPELVISVIYVMPTRFRPYSRKGGGQHECAPITKIYADVITKNNKLRDIMDMPQHVRQHANVELFHALAALYDSSYAANSQGIPDFARVMSLLSGLNKKEGRFRRNLLGKRVNYMARSVITGDPYLKINQVRCARLVPRLTTAATR